MIGADNGAEMYVYDAVNRRVRAQTASATNEYIYDFAGRRISTWLPNGAGTEGRIYWGNRQIAFRAVNGAMYFDHQDWHGTERIRTNWVGAEAARYTSFPFGDDYAAKVKDTYGDQDNNHFAQMDRDAESGTEHALFRQYGETQGRWMSPDPYTGSYDLTDPQSFNRYSYVLNNPMTFNDPSGLYRPGYYGYGGGGYCTTFPVEGYSVSESDSATGDSGGYSVPSSTVMVCSGSGVGPSSLTGLIPQIGSIGQIPSNGRNCTPAPASAGQYAAATAEVTTMSVGFFSGLGPNSYNFGFNSSTSQVMAQSGPVQEVLNEYYLTGQTSDLYTFGSPGYVSAGGNPVAQFVGSFRWTITPVNGGINLSLTNTTSFKSLTYDKGPQWQRFPIATQYGTFTSPMGNIHQTYNIFATCQ